MKKFSIMIFLLWIIFLWWCENSAPETPDIENNEPVAVEDAELISYKHEMQKPDFEEMINKDEIQKENYDEPWTTEYTLTQDDVDMLSQSAEYCQNWYSIIPYYWDDGTSAVHFTKDDLKVWKKFTVKWDYIGYNFYG